MEKVLFPGKVVMDCRQVALFKSFSNYTQVYSVRDQIQMILALSLCHVTKRLDQKQFLRVNRSTVINASFIQSIERQKNHLLITLRNGTKHKSSRRRTEQVLAHCRDLGIGNQLG